MQQDCPYKIWCSVRRLLSSVFQSIRVWIRHLACLHRLLRGWIYAGDIWHPLLMIYRCLRFAFALLWQY